MSAHFFSGIRHYGHLLIRHFFVLCLSNHLEHHGSRRTTSSSPTRGRFVGKVLTTTSYPMFACRSPNAGLALSQAFTFSSVRGLGILTVPGVDGLIVMSTFGRFHCWNRLGIPLTPLFQVGTGKGVALGPPETGVEARGPSNSSPTVPGLRLLRYYFSNRGAVCSDTLEKREMRVGYAPA